MKLPVPDHTPLDRPPLPLVVWQVRYEGGTHEADQPFLASLQEQLVDQGYDYPTVELVDSQPRWRLSSGDGWHVIVSDVDFGLEAENFRSFVDALPRMNSLLTTIDTLARPVVTSRIGLRFVNLISLPSEGGSIREWTAHVRAAYLPALGDDDVAAGVGGIDQRLLLHVSDQVAASVRVAIVDHEDQWKLAVDIDAFTSPQSLWDAPSVQSVTNALNDTCVSIFQHVLQPAMLNAMREGSTT